ncbi:MAG: ATP-binding protein [Myxococcota bacterium]
MNPLLWTVVLLSGFGMETNDSVPTTELDEAEFLDPPHRVSLSPLWSCSPGPFDEAGPTLENGRPEGVDGVQVIHQDLSPLPDRWDGSSWFWQRITYVGEPVEVHLWLQHLGDVDVFFDGRRVGGNVRAHGTAVDLTGRSPIELRIEPGEHLLALHVHNPWAVRLERMMSWAGFSAELNRSEDSFTEHWDPIARHAAFHGWLNGFVMALILFHLVLYAARRSRTDSLLCAASIFAFGLFIYLQFLSLYAESAKGHYATVLVSNALTPLGSALLARFFFGVTKQPAPTAFSVFQWSAIVPIVLLPYIGIGGCYAYGAAAALVVGLLLVQARRKRVRGLWVLSVGGTLLLLTVFIEVLSWFADLPSPEHCITLGFSALLVSISVYMASDFARTERESARRATALQEAERRAEMAAELERVNRELRDTQAFIVQNEKMIALGQLAAGLSHEMNNPLGAIRSGSQTMTAGVDKLDSLVEQSPSRARAILTALRDAARVVREGAAKVATIVKKLKSFARLDESKLQRFDLRELIRETIDILEPLWPPNIRRHVDVPQGAWAIGAPAELNQAFYQVLLNALQAQPSGGSVIIGCRQDGSDWTVWVEDRGPGIPEEIRSRVFDPGFTTKGNGVGTGLGLSIAYQILTSHGGYVFVEPGAEAGTRVLMRIPSESSESMDLSYSGPSLSRDG